MNDIIVRNSRWLSLSSIKDGYDGTLSVAEAFKSIPFEIKRVYYIYNLVHHDNVCRGKHAHKKLEQALFCVNGSCSISLDDGTRRQEIELADPGTGIYVGPGVWTTLFNFRNNCILIVFASDFFSEEDYIRDHKIFLLFVKSHPV
jgi:dTDP-4-dehydrorhamnose 3,5-epimerase-like enzyme